MPKKSSPVLDSLPSRRTQHRRSRGSVSGVELAARPNAATKERGLTVFNPGSIGPRRFHLPILYGSIELGPRGVRLAHVDAETGQPWLPPAIPGLST